MRTPTEVLQGRIVDYDERTAELVIRVPYRDWELMTKRQYKKCLVQPIDSRPLSDRQRKACYALLGEIADYTGEGKDMTKERMKLKYLLEDTEDIGNQIFSLSNAPMSLVCGFQRFLVRFIVDWDIPTRFPLLDMVDDVGDYLYQCLLAKKCCICGQHADLHHHSRIGNGRDREKIDQTGMPVEALCRKHHTECHSMPQKEFDEKYHIFPIPVDNAIKKIWRLTGERKRHDQF